VYKSITAASQQPIRFLGAYTDGGCDVNLKQYWVSRLPAMPDERALFTFSEFLGCAFAPFALLHSVLPFICVHL
jgi:hypothetical protein